MLRHLEADGDEYYHGIFYFPQGTDWGGLGRGRRPGYTAISGIWDKPRGLSGWVVAHELGHNLSLRHARCGVPADHPGYTAHADGSIGVWGHRFTDGHGTGFGRLLDPGRHTDVMGEDTCPKLETRTADLAQRPQLHPGLRPPAGACVGSGSLRPASGGARNPPAVGRRPRRGPAPGTRIRA